MNRSWLYRVLAANALIGTAVYAVRPIVSFRALELGAGPVELGVIGASYALIPLMVAIVIGRWVDRWGEPLFLTAGSTAASVVALLLVLADTLPALGLGMAVLGLSQILTAVSIQTLIANADEPGRRDSRFGWQSVAASIGQLVGPLTAGFVAGGPLDGGSRPSTSGIHLVFLMGALLAAAATAVSLTFLFNNRPRRRHGPRQSAGDSTMGATRRIIGLPSMPQAMFASMAVLTSVDILIVYLPAVALATGISVETVGLLLACRAGASIVSRSLITPLRTSLGRRELLALAMLIPAIAIGLLPIVGSAVLPLFAIMAVAGFGLGLGQPLTASWVAIRSPADLRGTAVGLRLSGNRLGQLLVPALVGVVAGAVGLSGAFWSLTTMLLAGTVLVAGAPFNELD